MKLFIQITLLLFTSRFTIILTLLSVHWLAQTFSFIEMNLFCDSCLKLANFFCKACRCYVNFVIYALLSVRIDLSFRYLIHICTSSNVHLSKLQIFNLLAHFCQLELYTTKLSRQWLETISMF